MCLNNLLRYFLPFFQSYQRTLLLSKSNLSPLNLKKRRSVFYFGRAKIQIFFPLAILIRKFFQKVFFQLLYLLSNTS